MVVKTQIFGQNNLGYQTKHKSILWRPAPGLAIDLAPFPTPHIHSEVIVNYNSSGAPLDLQDILSSFWSTLVAPKGH
jgi:hypothetical protein